MKRTWLVLLLFGACTRGPTEAPIDSVDSDPILVDTTPADTDADTPLPGVEVIADCILEETWMPQDGPSTVRLLFTAGTFQGLDEDHPNHGPVHVDHRLDEPTILVLASEEPTRWTITEEFEGSITHVHIIDHPDQLVEAPPGAVVEDDTERPLRTIESWAHPLARDIETFLSQHGLSATSLHHCQEASSFLLQPAETVAQVSEETDCAELGEPLPPPDLSLVEQRCPELLSEPLLCLNPRGEVFGFASRTRCPLLELPEYSTLPTGDNTLLWAGTRVFGTGQYGELVETDLVTGAREQHHIYFSDYGTWNGGLTAGSPPVWFSSVLAATCNHPQQSMITTLDSRFAFFEERAVSAWHSTDTITLWDVTTATAIRDIALGGLDGWIVGLSMPSDDVVVANVGGTLIVLDLTTDTPLSVFEETGMAPLHCVIP